jgi:peptide/nickel transport system permease protein
MASFLIRRLLLAFGVLFAVSIVSFTLLQVAGDLAQAIAGESATSADVEAARKNYGLDRPFLVRYLEWAAQALRGDLGLSYFSREPVGSMIFDRMPVTVILGLAGIAFALTLSLPLGVAAAMRPNSWLDRICLALAVVGQAMPSFWLALVLIIVFGLQLRWLPISGTGTWQHFVLPAVVLGYSATPALMRLTRTGMMEVLGSDYIRSARAKGLRWPEIVGVHALRNAMIPVVSLAAVQLGFMLGGSVIVEAVFALHGVGHLAYISISRADFPVVQGIVLVFCGIFVVLTLLGDLLNAALDPRIRLS